MKLASTRLACCALILVACGESHDDDMDAGETIFFDATFPDAGTDAGPPPSNVGARCESDDECTGEPADYCEPFLGGYCTVLCGADLPCPTGSTCVEVGRGRAVCVADCDPTSSEDQCLPGNGCTSTVQGLSPVCLPGCENDGECGDGLTCLLGAGSVGAGICVDDDAQLGGACNADADCPPSAECVSSVNYPGGTCVLFGCNASTNTGCPSDAQCLPGGFQGDICWDGCAANTDCRDGWECVDSDGRSICQPIFDPVNLGQVCSDERGSCAGGACLDEFINGFPDSYCAGGTCDPTAADPMCAGDGVCAETTDGGGLCIDGCATDDDCRAGYACRPVDSADATSPTACLPGCTEDSQCTAVLRDGTRYECNPGTGRCAAPLDPAAIGQPCNDFFDCFGGRCLTEAETGWPGGACTYPGCRLSGEGPSATCPDGSVCIDDGGNPDLGVCAAACAVGTTSCREDDGYACVALSEGSTEGACRPAACVADACSEGRTCEEATGLCQ